MKLNQNIYLVLKTYLLVLSLFSLYRIVLFLTELDRVNFDSTSLTTVFHAFFIGIRFDIVISGYILFIPAFVLFTLGIFKSKSRIVINIIFYWIFLFFTLAFFIAAADIPYFNQFYDRISIGAFEWIENIGFVVSMIFHEPKYFLIGLPFLALSFLFYSILRKIFHQKTRGIEVNIFLNVLISLLFLFVMFIGIRGRIQTKSPIRTGTAYFSDNSFLNKLGLNPVFTLLKSCLENMDDNNRTIHLMEKQLAQSQVQSALNINGGKYNSPIARLVKGDTSLAIKPNIIVVIMESMSAAKMARNGNTDNLTPFLDSLANHSQYFENIYTAGKHTFNGIFSTICSFPALYRYHPMKQIHNYNGMASTLKNHGYSTTYFTTHDSQFDNVEGFLRANGFENIVSQTDYPLSEVKTTLGVPDDYMFRFSINEINKLSKSGKPFLATFMTASDHGPYYIPDYFSPKTKNIKQQIVEYADWSLEQFISLASQQEWFKNTLFVFVADHGAPINANYEIALNYFHSPLIFYAPELFPENTSYKQIGSQIDIFPSIMGLLNLPYVNNTLGVDLFHENRNYVIINDDDKIGILDDNYFCIMRTNKDQLKLYKYRMDDKTNHVNDYKNKANEMANFAKSQMQVFQDMLLTGKINMDSSN